MEKFNIKKDTYEFNGNTYKGYFLTLNEYSLLRDVPKQQIVEEQNKAGGRMPFRKVIQTKDDKIFLSAEKPLYDPIKAHIFRLSKLISDPSKKIKIEYNEKYGLNGYWVNINDYSELTGLPVTTIRTRVKSNRLELGQFYEKEKEYKFFIVLDEDPYTIVDLETFIIKKELSSQNKLLREIKEEDTKAEVLAISKMLKKNSKLSRVLESFAELEEEDVKKIAEMVGRFSMEDMENLKIAADGYGKLFG